MRRLNLRRPFSPPTPLSVDINTLSAERHELMARRQKLLAYILDNHQGRRLAEQRGLTADDEENYT